MAKRDTTPSESKDSALLLRSCSGTFRTVRVASMSSSLTEFNRFVTLIHLVNGDT